MNTTKFFLPALVAVVLLATGCDENKTNETPEPEYTVTVTHDGNGTAVGGVEKARAGARVALFATANPGCEFRGWNVTAGDITLSPDAATNPVTFTMPAGNVSVSAEFTANPQYDVYVGGHYWGGGSSKVCYWKNGELTGLKVPEGAGFAYGGSMAVVGGDVYVTGRYSDGTDWIPCYWKNGEITSLSIASAGGNGTVRASSIVVDDDKVYIAGHTRAGDDKNPAACLWTNGERKDLAVPDEGVISSAESVAVHGTDVYVAGFYGDGTNYTACVWKNDDTAVGLKVISGATSALGYSLAVDGDDVYVAGYYKTSGNIIPCYWKNDEHIPLSVLGHAGDNEVMARSIVVEGSSVYIAGETWNGNINAACMWKDGERCDFDLPAAATQTYAYSVAVAGSDVYVAGYYKDSGNNVPCLWINGTRTPISATGNIDASVSSMVVVPR